LAAPAVVVSGIWFEDLLQLLTAGYGPLQPSAVSYFCIAIGGAAKQRERKRDSECRGGDQIVDPAWRAVSAT
jgi:hypothetical protein